MTDPIYSITDWDSAFENAASRKYKDTRWVPIPNRFDGERITTLICDGGSSIYGAWCAAVLVASRCDPRGTLVRKNGKPYDSFALERITRIQHTIFETMFEMAVEVGLMEVSGGQAHPKPTARPLGTHLEPKPSPTKERKNEGTEGKKEQGVVLAFNTAAFFQAWGEWEVHRLQIKKKLTPLAVTKQMNALKKLGEAPAIAAINHSIAQGWTGIHEQGNSNGRPTRQSAQPVAEEGKYKNHTGVDVERTPDRATLPYVGDGTVAESSGPD